MTTQLSNGSNNTSLQDFFYQLMSSYLRPTRLWRTEIRDSPAPTSLIFSPADGQRIPVGNIVVGGYALAKVGMEIERVELSVDGGKTWQETELSKNSQPGEWRMWRKHLSLTPRRYELVVRAVDGLTSHRPSDADVTCHRVNFEVVL